MEKKVFKVVVIEQVTERVWYEVTGVGSTEEATAACLMGEGVEVYRKHVSTNYRDLEEVYTEGDDALSMD